MDGSEDAAPDPTASPAASAGTTTTACGATATALSGPPGVPPAPGTAGNRVAVLAGAHGLNGTRALPSPAPPAPAEGWPPGEQEGAAAPAGAFASAALGLPPAPSATRGSTAGPLPPAKGARSTAAAPAPAAGDALAATGQITAAVTAAATTGAATGGDGSADDGATGATASAAAALTTSAQGGDGKSVDASLIGLTSDPALAQPRPAAIASAAPLQDPPANAMEKAVANQVSRSLVQNLPGGDRLMVVRLTPPELGTVRVEVVEHQGTLTAHLHAEDDGVRLAIEHYLPTMRAELRAHDAPIREISLTDQAPGRSFADGQQQPQNRQQPSPARGTGGGAGFAIAASAAPEAAGAVSTALGGTIDASGVDWRA